MAINESLAHLSDRLFTAAIATYSVAMICYAAEYAFGRRGRVASTSLAVDRALVSAGIGAAGKTTGTAGKATGAASSSSTVDARTMSVLVPPADSVTASGVRQGSLGDRLGRLGVVVTVIGALIHTGSLVARGTAAGRVPWGNMYEFASVVGLVAVLAFVVALVKAPQIRYLGLFAIMPVILVMFLAGTVWYAQTGPLVPALKSYWLAIHVVLVAVSEGVLMISAVITALFLLRQRYDRQIETMATSGVVKPLRFPVSLGARMPAPQTLDGVAYRIVAFAFPLYTCGVIAGAIWAEAAWGRAWGWDPKETWAFIAWVIYACYLHARATAGWKGSRAAWINLLGFGAMTFNYLVVNVVISGLHSYAGLN